MSSRSSRAQRKQQQDDQPGLEIHKVERSLYRGPLPSPDALAAYEKIQAGFANRIVKMAEEQAAHRREMEAKVIAGNVDAQRRSGWQGFVIVLVVMGFALLLIHLGEPAWAVALIIAELAALTGVFVYGKKKQASERVQKRAKVELSEALEAEARKALGLPGDSPKLQG